MNELVFPYEKISELEKIDNSEVKTKLNEWFESFSQVYESNTKIKPDDELKLLSGFNECKNVYYGESAESTEPFAEFFRESENPDEYFDEDIVYTITGELYDDIEELYDDIYETEYYFQKCYYKNYILLFLGNDCGDDSSAIIIGEK